MIQLAKTLAILCIRISSSCGGGVTRILYMNTCDPNQVWTTDHCQDQGLPVYAVNSTFGSLIENNQVNTHGSAVFFITNDHSGTLHIEDSAIRQNLGGYWYELPGISMHSDTNRQIVNSTID